MSLLLILQQPSWLRKSLIDLLLYMNKFWCTCSHTCTMYICSVHYSSIFCAWSQDVNELIQAALLRYSADRIAKFDFALENSGGSVITDKCSKTFPPALATYSVMGIPLWSIPSSPKAIIQVNHSNLFMDLFTSIHIKYLPVHICTCTCTPVYVLA